MILAKLYSQGSPIPNGTMRVDGESVTAYDANLIYRGEVEGVTTDECWLRARAITELPVMEWMK